MIDTGMTLTKASRELIARGASCVVAFATHALLSQDSADRLARCEELSFIIISNSVPIMATLPKDHALRRKLAVLSVAPMIAHHICKLSGLPLPDMDPQEPTHALHVSSNLTEEQPHSAAYLMKKPRGRSSKAARTARRRAIRSSTTTAIQTDEGAGATRIQRRRRASTLRTEEDEQIVCTVSPRDGFNYNQKITFRSALLLQLASWYFIV